MSKITSILTQLNTEDDTHWTGEGLPRLDVLSELAGEKITRAQLSTDAVGFYRGNADTYFQDNSEEAPEAEAEESAPTAPMAPAAPDAPVVTEDEENEEELIDPETEELSEAEKVKLEYDESVQALDKARIRHAKAAKAYNRVVTVEAKQNESVSQADHLKAYKESRRGGRRADANRRKVLASLLSPSEKKKLGR